jgi:glycerophosphoryl diester phosphodiesterase
VKLYGETCLQYSNAHILLNILKHFCNITLEDEQMLAELKSLEGSFRIFQYFLRILYENHGNDKAEILKISNLKNLIEKTYMEWKNNDLLVQLFNNSLLFENTLKEILFSSLYPNFFLGKLVLYNPETKKITDYREDLIDNSLKCVANFARNQFPDKWMKYHDIGLVRWKIVDNSYIMEPPFPFLIKLWCDHSAKYLFPSVDIEHLNSCLSTGLLATGVLGHAFQYAVALELTLPYSPLFKKILPNGYLPFSEQYRLETFTIDSQPNIASATIFYANDRSKPVTSYDIITFINDMNGNAKKVLIQVKNDTNSTRCRESAKNLFRLDADVKVIISWHEHKLSSLAQDKCIVIEGSGQFTGTAIPFNFIFGNMSQISDHREIRNQLCKHPFFQNFLDPSLQKSPKRRKWYISQEQSIASTSYATQPTLGMPTAGGSGQQMSTALNPEPFNLDTWIANRLGLDLNSEEEKNRLNELMVAFRKAGFRTKELVESFDKEAIDAINSELPEGKKLKLGEIIIIIFTVWLRKRDTRK